MAGTVLLSIADGIADVRLNRPHRLNAINPQLLADFAAALEQAQSSAEVQVILLRGEGRAFCAGDDLKEFDDQARGETATRRYVEQIQDITRLLLLRDKVVVGAIHGWAVGGGLEWVINCDIAVMGTGCRCFFPELLLGVFVTGGVTSLLPNHVGLQKAKELILLGERFGAASALEMGLVARVVGDDDVLPTARAMAEKIRDLPPLMRVAAKKILTRAYQLPLEQAMDLETDATVAGFLDPATRDRVAGALK